MLVRESCTNPAKGAFGRRKNRIRVLAGDKVLVEMTPCGPVPSSAENQAPSGKN
jgi:hypothetical protein